MLAKTVLKKWLNIPSWGVSDITFFHPQLLGIKPPSKIYPESHSGNYKVRFKADKVVNSALDAGLEREVLHSCQMWLSSLHSSWNWVHPIWMWLLWLYSTSCQVAPVRNAQDLLHSSGPLILKGNFSQPICQYVGNGLSNLLETFTDLSCMWIQICESFK